MGPNQGRPRTRPPTGGQGREAPRRQPPRTDEGREVGASRATPKTVIPAKPRSGVEPGPMGHFRIADGLHGSRVVPRSLSLGRAKRGPEGGPPGMMGWTFPLFGDEVRFVCEANRPNREGEGP